MGAKENLLSVCSMALPIDTRHRLQAQLSSMKREFCRREALQQSRYETVVTRLAQEVSNSAWYTLGSSCTPFRFPGVRIWMGYWCLGFRLKEYCCVPVGDMFTVKVLGRVVPHTYFGVKVAKTTKRRAKEESRQPQIAQCSNLEKLAFTENLHPHCPRVYGQHPPPSTSTREQTKHA